MDLEIETAFFKRFIAKNRKDRFVWNLASAKRRDKIFEDLRDTRHFDDSKITQVECSDDVVKFLRDNRITKSIYIISSDEDLDGREISIGQMMEPKFWMPEEILGFCKEANVGFFKNHEEWYFLLK